MSPPVNSGDGPYASDDESFVSASAISPTLSKPPPPPVASKPTIAAKPTTKPKPELAPKPIPATAKRVVSDTIRNVAGPSTRSTSGSNAPAPAAAAGSNSKLATGQPSVRTVPMPDLAASPTLTKTKSSGQPSTASRPPAVKPKPTIRLGPVSRSHFANNPLPVERDGQAQTQAQAQSSNRVIASERYVTSPPTRTESKRYTTPPPGSSTTVFSQRLGNPNTNNSSTSSTQPIPITEHGRPPPPRRPSSQGQGRSYEAEMRGIHTPQPSMGGLSVDNLANAMVAGALATSAATSRSHSLTRPPPPPPARRSGTSLFDKLTPGHSRHGSRAGSPEKGNGKRQMKMTLRKEEGSGDEEDGRHGRHRKRNLVKKHPNKHHEGDRKRWRDVVTEKERKRYEGLWASNRGICVGEPVRNSGRWVNANESQVSLGRYGDTGMPSVGPGSWNGGAQAPMPFSVNMNRPGSRGDGTQGSIKSMAGLGSFQTTGVGSSQTLPSTFQAPGLRVSPYMNPTLSASQNQSMGFGPGQAQSLGPYSNSMQNISRQSLATTSGSNSGNNSSPYRPGGYILPPSRTIATLEPQDCVSSLVVRDIWSRSRLPPDVLREVWDLVDRSGQGMLCKDEFCAGLWLLDVRLRGRKLPQKVSDSVWRSLGGLSGVKIKEFKGKDKKGRVASGGR